MFQIFYVRFETGMQVYKIRINRNNVTMTDNGTKFISKSLPISSLSRKITSGEIDMCPPWHRNVVWNTEMHWPSKTKKN